MHFFLGFENKQHVSHMFKANSFVIVFKKKQMEELLWWMRTLKRKTEKISDSLMIKVLNSQRVADYTACKVCFCLKDLQTLASVVKVMQLDVKSLECDNSSFLTQTMLSSDFLKVRVQEDADEVQLGFELRKHQVNECEDRHKCVFSVHSTIDGGVSSWDYSNSMQVFDTFKELNKFEHEKLEMLESVSESGVGMKLDVTVETFVKWMNVVLLGCMFAVNATVCFNVETDSLKVSGKNNWNVVCETAYNTFWNTQTCFKVNICACSLFFCKVAIESLFKKPQANRIISICLYDSIVVFKNIDQSSLFIAETAV